jgi:tetratricopeptide (TPR) repeat protein
LVLNWKKADQYGFCYEIEKVVATVLDDEACALLIAHLQKCVDDALKAIHPPMPAAFFEYDNAVRLPALSLKEVFQVRGDSASYAALCERLGMSPMDCQRLAEMKKAKRHWKQALEWIDKGLALEGERNWHNESARSLDDMRIELLGRLGRKDEAVAQAWTAFEKYQETLEAVSHYPAEQAAKGLAKPYPVAAAALHRAMGFRVLASGKSKYYVAALSNFKQARSLYLKAGLASEWEATVSRVHSEHGRKHGFVGDFDRLAAGAPKKESTFDARVRERLKTIAGG